MPAAPTYAVTGATGQLGRRVATRLSESGVEHRLVCRNSSRAPQLEGTDVAQAAYDDPGSMKRALEGVHSVFLVSATESADRVRVHKAAIDAALDAGVERIVYLSFLAAAPDATFTFARDHYATEQHIRSTGVRHTFLRPSLYVDLLPSFASSDGVIRGPAGSGQLAGVARDDLADVAAAVLASDDNDGQTFDVTGPEPFTLADVAAELSRRTGRQISFADETLEEARSSRAGTGAPAWAIEGWVTSYAAIASGELDVVSETVEAVAGHAPMSLAETLERNPDCYRHLLR